MPILGMAFFDRKPSWFDLQNFWAGTDLAYVELPPVQVTAPFVWLLDRRASCFERGAVEYRELDDGSYLCLRFMVVSLQDRPLNESEVYQLIPRCLATSERISTKFSSGELAQRGPFWAVEDVVTPTIEASLIPV